jgi:uncharacterized protein
VVAVRIEIDSREGNRGAFAHVYGPEELDFNDDRVRLIQPPEISGWIVRKGNQVLVSGRVSARTQVDCDRCLKSVGTTVLAEFSLQCVTAVDYQAAHAAELEESDLALSIYDGEAIDIDEIVREQVLLAVPTRALCREDCKGFCPNCGADRNVKECDCPCGDSDPRWAGLKELVNRQS